MIDIRQIRDKALVELLYKAESLCYNDVTGTPTRFNWNDVLLKYQAIKVIDDYQADDDTKDCAAWWLNEHVDQKIVSIQSATLEKMYILVYGQPYRGTVSSSSQMTVLDSQQKVEGWWWSVTGNFTYDGITYTIGDEIYWNNEGFNILGSKGVDTTPDDLTGSGFVLYKISGEAMAFGDMCRIGVDGNLYIAKADSINTSSALYMCIQPTLDALTLGKFLMQGIARNDAWGWTVGGMVYLSTTGTTGNTLTQTVISGTDEVVQVIGVASRSNEITISPNLMQVEHV